MVHDDKLGTAGLDDRRVFGIGGLHLWFFAFLGVLAADKVVWRRLSCLDDEDALRG